MEMDGDLDDYSPRNEKALLTMELYSGSRWAFLRTNAALLFAVIVSVGTAFQLGRPYGAVAVLLPAVFFFAGLFVLAHRSSTSSVRFLSDSIEFSSAGRGWRRVSWDLITRAVKDGAGGAYFDTDTAENGGMRVAHLPKARFNEVLAAALLPAHVAIIDVPTRAPGGAKKILLVWLALVCVFVFLWHLTQQ